MTARRPSVAALLATLRPICAAPRLVHDGEGADPMVLVEGDTCHLYTTNAGMENVPHFTAPDLDGWTHRGDALPALGAWAVGGHTWRRPSAGRRPVTSSTTAPRRGPPAATRSGWRAGPRPAAPSPTTPRRPS